ncbi:hypothetical protein L1987_85047 [Smallanthus sonchifolius]|uniref:Uncharacterized protein n=1 Tax=Smallanthus sonchifolius TaxID=185202 RepID=A0ACB8XW97_9ASTR|nr:hypothetical protein L1987_85047 [Smallanthus sonchifolius]
MEDELEDGEFRLPSLSPAGAGDPSREDETNRRMGMGRIFQDLSSPNKAAHADESMHVEAEGFKSPGGPTLMVDHKLDEPNCSLLVQDLGLSSAFNSKKRPRRFRSLDDAGFDLGPLYPGLVDEDNSSLPFPDLNSVIPDTCPSAAALSSKFNNVEETVRVEAGIGIQLHGFENQVRKLVEGEGVQNVPQ